jgi:hypothetical protein
MTIQKNEKVRLTFDAPNFVRMIRDEEEVKETTEKDAVAYVQSLPVGRREAVNGCYTINCLRPCKVPIPVACSYHLNCSWCLWPGISTIPFGCFVITSGDENSGYYTNLKGDTVIIKVDEEKETLACFAHNSAKSGSPCCLCYKVL